VEKRECLLSSEKQIASLPFNHSYYYYVTTILYAVRASRIPVDAIKIHSIKSMASEQHSSGHSGYRAVAIPWVLRGPVS